MQANQKSQSNLQLVLVIIGTVIALGYSYYWLRSNHIIAPWGRMAEMECARNADTSNFDNVLGH